MDKYEINVAKANGRKIFGTDAPAYTHFCRVDAGEDVGHAIKVLLALRNGSFPAPEYNTTLTKLSAPVGTRIEV